MRKKIIVKISEGLGNQLFMYANSYSLSKKNNLDLFIDPFSGYHQKKHMYEFFLNRFNISSKIANKNYIFANNSRNFLKKILIFVDKFKSNKKFIFEKKDFDKSTCFSPLNLENTNNYFFLDGNFETEKYFLEYRTDLLNEFKINNENKFNKNKYLDIIKNNNVISICIRQNRYSERIKNFNSPDSINKSNQFLKNTVDYINKAIIYFKDKVENPYFLIWSNDFKNLDKFFNTKNFTFVQNNDDKVLTDFYLLTQCKYFIVGPSTFHWWGAWLSPYKDKICVRPKNINPSNNKNFWPESWFKI